jgi:hypothetical protein
MSYVIKETETVTHSTYPTFEMAVQAWNYLVDDEDDRQDFAELGTDRRIYHIEKDGIPIDPKLY